MRFGVAELVSAACRASLESHHYIVGEMQGLFDEVWSPSWQDYIESSTFSLGPCRGEVTPTMDKSKNRDALRLHAIDEAVPTNVDFSEVGLVELDDHPATFGESCKTLAGLPDF
jgi:hypothetical protein